MKFARQVVLVLVLQGPGLVESQVRLSEVMADPPGSESHDEFVELSNIGLDTLDLAGWQLGDGEELDRIADAGEGTRLAPGAMALVLDGSYKGASTTYESVQELARIVTIEDRAFGRGGWSNSTPERVLVVSAAGDTVDVLTYDPMAAHPGCTMGHMQAIRKFATKTLHLLPEQVQIFTPTPATYSTLMYHTKRDPFTGQKIFVEKNLKGKEAQKRIITGQRHP